jgi:hypothetical protein
MALFDLSKFVHPLDTASGNARYCRQQEANQYSNDAHDNEQLNEGVAASPVMV